MGNRVGGSYDSTLNNCLLSGNIADDDGGGSHGGALNSCTLSGNSATNDGGGSVGGTLNNCVIFGNTSANTPNDNVYTNGGTFAYSCSTPLLPGTGNITNDPAFVDSGSSNYRLSFESPAIDSGTNSAVVGSADLDGNALSPTEPHGCLRSTCTSDDHSRRCYRIRRFCGCLGIRHHDPEDKPHDR